MSGNFDHDLFIVTCFCTCDGRITTWFASGMVCAREIPFHSTAHIGFVRTSTAPTPTSDSGWDDVDWNISLRVKVEEVKLTNLLKTKRKSKALRVCAPSVGSPLIYTARSGIRADHNSGSTRPLLPLPSPVKMLPPPPHGGNKVLGLYGQISKTVEKWNFLAWTILNSF